jgi:flagellin-like protein
LQRRRGVSPFIATVVLVAITLALGGVLYNQFRQVVSAEVRNPSVSLVDTNVGQDGRTLLLDVKNDGNVQLVVSQVIVQYQNASERFDVGGNLTVLAGSATIAPGALASLRMTLGGMTLPSSSDFTVTLVSDQLARAFSAQA